jgi:L-alanine-DL-glutamate epimerase-like enolase superfamily enzyme
VRVRVSGPASIEAFRRESLALVRLTASDGRIGWGQVAPYEADISAQVLHRLISPQVIGRDISEIDAINDATIDARSKWLLGSTALQATRAFTVASTRRHVVCLATRSS